MRTRLMISVAAAVAVMISAQIATAARTQVVPDTTYNVSRAARVAQQLAVADGTAVELARHGYPQGHYRGPYRHQGFRGYYYGPPRPAYYGPPRPVYHGRVYRAYRPSYFPYGHSYGYGGGGYGCGYRGGGYGGGGFGLYLSF